ncbi:MAG: beta-mannosidase [Bacteroidia bacterium]|nr:beta-mannosidase [Bacteroidia bacterium]
MKSYLVLICMALTYHLTAQTPVDKKATRKTRALYRFLARSSESGFMFGHQDTDAYGVNWKAEENRSDVKDVCGSYPAVHGWDLGKLGQQGNIDNVEFKRMHAWIKQTYKRGGINTISWHVDNPTTRGNAWDTTATVHNILPGGKDHTYYLQQLDLLAGFLRQCKAGWTRIPIIFRPYHEHNGNWFWWGKGNCSEAEYIELWRFTQSYLVQKKKLHNLLFAFSPDRSRLTMDSLRNADSLRLSYLYGYPGDDHVDILGYDDYMDAGVAWNKKSRDEQQHDLVAGLKMVSTLAAEKDKVAALTETGLESITMNDWFTGVMLAAVKADPAIRIAYMLVWRNANTRHHYAPYTGHTSERDFLLFYHDPLTLFENDITGAYR